MIEIRMEPKSRLWPLLARKNVAGLGMVAAKKFELFTVRPFTVDT